jgi:hypothetical protein
MANEMQVETQISFPEHLPAFSGTGRVAGLPFNGSQVRREKPSGRVVDEQARRLDAAMPGFSCPGNRNESGRQPFGRAKGKNIRFCRGRGKRGSHD